MCLFLCFEKQLWCVRSWWRLKFSYETGCPLPTVVKNHHKLSGLRKSTFFSSSQFWRPNDQNGCHWSGTKAWPQPVPSRGSESFISFPLSGAGHLPWLTHVTPKSASIITPSDSPAPSVLPKALCGTTSWGNQPLVRHKASVGPLPSQKER